MYSKSLDKSDVSAAKPTEDSLLMERQNKIKGFKLQALDFLKMGVNYKDDAIKMLKDVQKSNFNRINKDRPDTDRGIIDLALEREIPEVLEILFKTISTGNRSTVIGGKENDYHALKQFIERSLQLDHITYQANSKTKCSILKQLIEIDPGLIEMINEEISHISSSHPDKVDANTLHAFKKDFDALCKQNPQSSLLFMAQQNEQNSSSNIKTRAPSS